MPTHITQARNVDGIIAAWKNRLLDLSKRNRALNFKVNKVSTITIVDELPPEVFRILGINRKGMKFGPSTKDEEDSAIASETTLFDEIAAEESDEKEESDFAPYSQDQLDRRYTDDVLQTNASAEKLDKSLRRIDDQAKSIIDELGVNALFLSLGMLHYAESGSSEITFKAPLLLLPVELRRTTAREGYRVYATDEETILNPSLVEYLRTNFGIELPEFPEASDLDERSDLQAYFADLAAAIVNQPKWKISNEIYLGLFFFQKLVMYKDLEKNTDAVKSHHIFQRVLNRDGDTHLGLPEDIRSLNLDNDFPPEAGAQVVDADSSQLRAIAAVAKNHDLVMEGPPGTGKSQTITNLIAQAFADGKSVLFVAEKMAALEVVYRRLQAIGLGEFCLELHSTKANKRSVMKNLGATLDASLTDQGGTDLGTQRLSNVRGVLTDYVRTVHEPFGALGCSPYQVYARLNKVIDANKAPFTVDVSAVSESDLADVLRDLADLTLAGNQIGDTNSHPWRDTTRTFYSEHTLDSLSTTIRRTVESIESFLTSARQIEDVLGLPPVRTFDDLMTATTVASVLARSPGAPAEVLRSNAWNSAPPETNQLIELGRRVSQLKARILTTHFDGVFENDPIEQIEYVERKLSGFKGFFAFLDKRFRSLKKRWISLRRDNYECSLLDQAQELRSVTEFLGQRESLNNQQALARELFGALWNADLSNWDELDAYVRWVLEFREVYLQRGLDEHAVLTASAKAPDTQFLQELKSISESIKSDVAAICGVVGWPEQYFSSASVSEIKNRITEILTHLHQCHGWAAFENIHQKVKASFASEILDWIASGQVSLSNISPCFERAFYQRWLSDVFESRPQLREFHAVTHEQRIKEFQELDKKILLQNRRNITSTLRSHLQRSLQTPEISQQMLDLRSQLRRQRGIMPLRVLMKRCFNVINAIKPCFMMSPQTVAQLLEKDRAKFDLVIFDEASQLPTEDAVGAIIRGDQLVVVGDPKQLPPTNFFAVANGQVNVERDEDGELVFQESESILEEVQNSGVPSSRLRWHYRSSNESLITFSNVRFYESDLFTFPSNETDAYQSGLTFEYVENGVYEGKGLNAVEARRVADAVVKLFKNYPNDSIGVGTFNLRQQLAILDELEIRRREDPSLEKLFDRSVDEPFFVKNLENIQGDERDTILLSVTYAKALDGRLRYNFGPLNAENGWRRMNVLTSRARKRMTVFSSIRSEDIHLEETTSKGAELLHSFLRYAEHRLLDSEHISASAETDSPFEYEVYQELTRRGLRLQPQVGVSGYKIDLGVFDDEVTDRFVCGIECDGVSYHSSETARDRDRLRQQVLERRGWTIHRVWSTDWFKDREGQISRLLNSIDLSRELARSKNTELHLPKEREDEPNGEASLPVFEIGSSSPIQFVLPSVPDYDIAAVDASNFLSFHQTPSDNIARMILQVIQIEAPVHIDDICSRIAGAFGSRSGRRIALRIQGLVDYLAGRGAITSRDGFVYVPDTAIALRRRSGSGIPINRVAPEEIQAAIARILADGHHFERPILINHVRSLFGFDRSGPIVKTTVENVIAECLKDGLIGEGQLGIGLRSTQVVNQ